MSDDNLYEFNENEASTFDIPDDNTEPTKDEVNNSEDKQQEQEPTGEEEDDEEYDPSSAADTPVSAAPSDPRKKNKQAEQITKQAGEGEDLYDSVDEEEEEEEKKIESESNPQSSNEPEETQPESKEQSESVSETKSEETSHEPKEQNQEEQQQKDKEEDEEEEEEEDDYDPTAELSADNQPESSTIPTSAPISTPAVASNPSSGTPNTQATALANSLPAGSNSNDLQQSVAKIMSSNLLSDPEFLSLSLDQQQKRIISLLQTDSQQSQPQSTQFQTYSNTQYNAPGSHRPDLRTPMTLEEIAKYNTFVDNEAKYATGRHTPAPNSRLFVGNLPSNSISKQDLFRLFQGYGHILQISLKGSYAFLQYDDSEAVEKAIKAERGIPLGGKDLVLEIAKNSRPGQTTNDRLYNNNSTGNAFQDRKRGRDEFDAPDKRRRRTGPIECQIFVKRTADPAYAREVAREFQNSNIATEYEFLRPGQDLSKKINDSAYSGVLAVVLINKNRNCDVQIYEKTPEGSVRYDEYLSINSVDATKLLLRAKEKQYSSRGNNGPSSSFGSGSNSYGIGSRNSYSSQQSSYNQGNSYYQPQQQQPPPAPVAPQDPQQLLQSLTASLGTSGLQNLLALAQTQQAGAMPQQGFQQPYQQPQFQQPAPVQQSPYGAPAVDLASLLGKVQGQAQPPQQQQFSNQGYNPMGGNSYQPYQQPQQPTPPQPQQQPQQQQQQQQQPAGSNVQSLLDTLAKLQK